MSPNWFTNVMIELLHVHHIVESPRVNLNISQILVSFFLRRAFAESCIQSLHWIALSQRELHAFVLFRGKISWNKYLVVLGDVWTKNVGVLPSIEVLGLVVKVLQSARSCIKSLFRISTVASVLVQILVLLGKFRHKIALVLIRELHEFICKLLFDYVKNYHFSLWKVNISFGFHVKWARSSLK